MTKVIGYVRVSTGKQDLQRQKTLINDYCNGKGYKLVKYIGDKKSGATSQRSGLNELLAINKSVADMVVVSELSRISREDDIMNVLTEIDSIRKNGLDLFILDTETRINVSDNMGGIETMQLVFKAIGNAEERKKIAERMKTGKYSKIIKNHYAYTGGFIPYGYKVIDNPIYNGNETNNIEPKRIIKPNEEEVNILKMLFDKVINGYTGYRLAKFIKDNNIRYSKNGTSNYNIRNGLYKIIHKRIYIGERTYKGKVYQIEPIIEKKVFDKAEQCLKVNREYISYKRKNFSPLKGLITCTCGYKMPMQNYTKNTFGYECLRKRDNLKNILCTNKSIMLEWAISGVWETTKAQIVSKEYKLKGNEKEIEIQKDIEIVTESISNNDENIKMYEENNRNITERITNNSVLSNEILFSALQNKYADNEKNIKLLKGKNKEKESIIIELKHKLKEVHITETTKELENLSLERKAEILHKLIDNIIWNGYANNKGFMYIKYKNGMNIIVMLECGRKYGYIYELPHTFKYDEETNKVIVKFGKTKKGSFVVSEEIREFDYIGILKTFKGELNDWIITKVEKNSII
jgi:site-specific DNA recombinase